MSCIGIVLAFIGLILLAGPENNPGAGAGRDHYPGGAIAIAAEIILISAWAGKVDVKRVTVVQLATASLVAFATMVPAGESVPPMSTGLWWLLWGWGSSAPLFRSP
jgi:drug/metabolite transporter (DMT)-like permease